MLRKKLSKEEWPIIGNCLWKRKSEGKDSQVFLNRVPFPNSKVQRELRRNKRILQPEGTKYALPYYWSYLIIDFLKL
jgi:hypothetical protein